jgi:NAD(P)H-dependent FMN reductase
MHIAIILGSTRPGRRGMAVAEWVLSQAAPRSDATFELVDLADFDLPLFDEPFPPAMGKYTKPHTQRWAAKIATFDAFVFVTPEYNRSTSGVLKNAIDFLKNEWRNKAAGFVGYGSLGAARAIEHLRQMMGELEVADVRGQVTLSLFTDWENLATFHPGPQQAPLLEKMLDQVVAWSRALAPLRAS